MKIEAVAYDKDVEAFLVAAGLTVSDISTAANLQFFGIRGGDAFVGVVGVEAYGQIGMLRSLAVAGSCQHQGYGQALVRFAETWASRHGMNTLYLLTVTAAPFFERLGYKTIQRTEAPASIAATSQFSALCPTSAVLMRKALAADN